MLQGGSAKVCGSCHFHTCLPCSGILPAHEHPLDELSVDY